MPLIAYQRRQLLVAEVIYKGQYFPDVGNLFFSNPFLLILPNPFSFNTPIPFL